MKRSHLASNVALHYTNHTWRNLLEHCRYDKLDVMSALKNSI